VEALITNVGVPMEPDVNQRQRLGSLLGGNNADGVESTSGRLGDERELALQSR